MSGGEEDPLLVNSGGDGSTSWWVTHKKKFLIGAVVTVVVVVAVAVPLALLLDDSGITNCQELQNMQNNLGGKHKLSKNIDCSATRNWNDGAGFIPVGDYDNPFTGEFNGNGHTITGLYIYAPTRQYCGLFGRIYYAVGVKNVFLSGADVTCDGNTAALIGYDLRGKVTNSHVTGNIRGSNRVGGLIGYASSSTIEDCSADVSVTGSAEVGALIGGTQMGSAPENPILRCSSHGVVVGVSKVGGLVGGCGHAIRYSFSRATVSGESSVGGLAGYHIDKEIRDCYASGTVACTRSSSGTAEVGGFLGYTALSGRAVNSYSTGLVTFNYEGQYIGGFIGRGAATDCYWDVETSERDTSAGDAIGKTTQEMQTPSTYDTWDQNIWNFVQGEYPTLVEVPEPMSSKQ